MTVLAYNPSTSVFLRSFLASLLTVGLAATVEAQSMQTAPPAPPTGSSLESDVQEQAPSPYLGSVTSKTRSPGVIDLSLAQALDRAMRVNLGLLLDSTASDKARAARWNAISRLLPHVNASLGESTRRANLRALGIPLSDLPTTVDVDNVDARLSVSQSIFDPSAISRVGAAGASERAALNDYRYGRETVAAVVAGVYLSVASARARLDYADADLKTAEALYQLAMDREQAGLSPEVDTLRARVERQSRQESVIDASNALAKRRITLLRLLGLDLRQPIRLTDRPGDRSIAPTGRGAAYAEALKAREDYRAALEQVRAAELTKRAARLERAPRLEATADYGALGTTPGSAVPTWDAGVVLHVPIFEGGRIGADVARADAALREKRAALGDLRARIAQDVETALLDLGATRQQVEVSRSAVGYATRALRQSRDRFAAGVTNNIEVIQAQEALASANERWVASLYAWNIARVLLARATGTAEGSVRTLLAPARSTPQ